MADTPNTIRGWPGGMNNVLPDYELPTNDKGNQNQLRNIVNADVLPSGRLKRRSGTTKHLTGRVHSLYASEGYAYAVIDNVLSAITPDFTATAIVTLSSTAKVYYTQVGDKTFYSNGLDKGCIVNNQARHWGVESPSGTPVLTAGAGAIPPGQYMVITTFVDSYGEESGCGNSSVINLTAAGGITMSLPQPTQAYVDGIRIYFAATNDTVLYEMTEVPVGVTTYTITMLPTTGMALETQFMAPFPAAELLEEYNGRIYGTDGNILWHTEPLRYGLYKPSTNFMQFAAPISVIAPVGNGMYVVADKTYWLSGASPDEFTISTVLKYTAAKGSLSRLPVGDEVVWYSSAGIVRAADGGNIKLIQEPNVRGAPSDTGATIYVEEKGVKKVLAAVSGEPFATGLSSTDYMDAEIERARR